MQGHVGDRIILAANRAEGPVRDGEVLEVRGPNGGPPYLVRWSDGHVGLVFPGPDAVMRAPGEDLHHRPRGEHAPGAAAAPPSGEGVVKKWDVQVSLYETGDDTSATAVLFSGKPEHLTASGVSHRSAEDVPTNTIGDEIAVARALRHLADTLISTAEGEIEAATGEDAFVRPL